jgi:branched-chain amino acid aminotransferase
MSAFASMTNVDGRIERTEEARIPVLDRGFLYGDSVYEVFRTYNGVPLLYEEHWTRFGNSAALIRLRVPFSLERMTDEIRRTVRATGAPAIERDVYVRYAVTRGQGAIDLYPDPALEPSFVIIVREAPTWPSELYSRGLRTAIVSTRRNPVRSLDPNIKGGNYLNNVLAVMEARELGADDCIMLNEAELVAEASNSNVFFVLDDELVTPGQTTPNLRGLTKQAVHEACAVHGLESRERDIPAEALPRATECFFTSATREIMPVATLRQANGETLSFPEGGGPITRRVAGYYREFINDYVRGHSRWAMF